MALDAFCELAISNVCTGSTVGQLAETMPTVISSQFLKKLYAKCLESKCRERVESKLEDGQCNFRPGGSTTYQIFTLKQIFEKFWEYGKDLFACFVDLENTYNQVPREKTLERFVGVWR